MFDINALKNFLFDGGLIYLDGTDAEIASALNYLFFESGIQEAHQRWFSDYFTDENEWNGNSFENWKFVLIDKDTHHWNMYKESSSLLRSSDIKIIRFSELENVFSDEDDDSEIEMHLSDLYGFV